MRAITKLAKIHPAAKKFCGWEEPAIWFLIQTFLEQKKSFGPKIFF